MCARVAETTGYAGGEQHLQKQTLHASFVCGSERFSFEVSTIRMQEVAERSYCAPRVIGGGAPSGKACAMAFKTESVERGFKC